MKFFPRLLFVVPLLLAACGPSPQQTADYASVQQSGVSSTVYDKMVHGDDLDLADIKALARAHVSDDVVIRYVQDHRTVYILGGADVRSLRSAGVSQRVIDYLMRTRTAIGDPNAYPPYTQDPFYPNFGPGGGGGPR